MTNDHWMLKGCYLRMTWLVSLSVFVAICSSCAARADDKTEVEYLLAGMLQERGKLHSGSCVIDGFERINGAYEMKYLFKGDQVRFTRTRKTAPPVIEDACDNGNQIIWWDHSNSSYSVQKSLPSIRKVLSIWDPHTAGLSMIGADPPTFQRYIEIFKQRLPKLVTAVARDGSLRKITIVDPTNEFTHIRAIKEIDNDRGFAPLRTTFEYVFTDKSKYPGKIEVNGELTSEWKQINHVWVPVHHRNYIPSGDYIYAEYKLSWEWVNRDVDDREFTLEALHVPAEVKQINLINGDFPATSPPVIRPRVLTPLGRLLRVIISIGLLLVVLLLLWRRLRKAPPSVPPESPSGPVV